MFEMLKHRCRVCGGYTNTLIVGDRCLSCAYTPAGRPIGNGEWNPGEALREPDWGRLFDAACFPDASESGDVETVRLRRRLTVKGGCQRPDDV